MYLKYWYRDELDIFSELDERGSDWIFLTSREFEKVFGYKGKYALFTIENDAKRDSDSQKAREARALYRMEEIWKNLKSIRRIRDVALPYRVICDEKKFFYNKKE